MPTSEHRLVLIADRFQGTRDLLKDIVASELHAYAMSISVPSAVVEAVRESVPHLIIIEVSSPVDQDLARRLREIQGLHTVPILAITPLDDRCDELRSLEFTDCMTKPFELDTLIARLRELLPR